MAATHKGYHATDFAGVGVEFVLLELLDTVSRALPGLARELAFNAGHSPGLGTMVR